MGLPTLPPLPNVGSPEAPRAQVPRPAAYPPVFSAPRNAASCPSWPPPSGPQADRCRDSGAVLLDRSCSVGALSSPGEGSPLRSLPPPPIGCFQIDGKQKQQQCDHLTFHVVNVKKK